jgi:uncharacterized membrane protein
MSKTSHNTSTKVIHIPNHQSQEIIIVRDEDGNVVSEVSRPLMLIFYPHDVFQVLVGAMLLALPLTYTEEAWGLGASLGWLNIGFIIALSIMFVATFVYYNVYRGYFKEHAMDFFKRVFGTYILAVVVSALFLTLVDRAPWVVDTAVAIKRTALIAFAASMSGAVADMVK